MHSKLKNLLFFFLLLFRASVSRHRVLSLRWPGGLPAQEQAHLFAVLLGQEPGRRQPYLRRKYSAQPEERVSMSERSWKSSLESEEPCINADLHPFSLHMSLQLCVFWKREWRRIHGHEQRRARSLRSHAGADGRHQVRRHTAFSVRLALPAGPLPRARFYGFIMEMIHSTVLRMFLIVKNTESSWRTLDKLWQSAYLS